MKPFSLDAVLRYRKQRQDEAATLLSKKLDLFNEAKSHLEAKNKEYQGLLDSFDSAQKTGLGLDELLLFQRRISWLLSEIERLKTEVKKKQDDVAYARADVIRKSRDHKVMEQLKEKQNSEYKHYLDKKETLQLDEIAVLSHDRRNIEEQ